MKQIVIVSGKGGSGKTFVSSSIAAIASTNGNAGRTTFADCDVDAANLHLMLDPRDTFCNDFVSGKLAEVAPERCTACGRCVEACRFKAVSLVDGEAGQYARVDPIACEGCGVCEYVCPEDAVVLSEQRRGSWCVSSTPFGPLVHAHLEPGEENSGKLVAKVRHVAAERARDEQSEWVLIDGPSGTGCAAKSAITGTDYVLLVAEPTPSGIHDMLRIVDLARHFRIPIGLVVNKADLAPHQTDELRRIASEQAIAWLGEIPFSRAVPEALTTLTPYPVARNDGITATIMATWNRVRGYLSASRTPSSSAGFSALPGRTRSS